MVGKPNFLTAVSYQDMMNNAVQHSKWLESMSESSHSKDGFLPHQQKTNPKMMFSAQGKYCSLKNTFSSSIKVVLLSSNKTMIISNKHRVCLCVGLIVCLSACLVFFCFLWYVSVSSTHNPSLSEQILNAVSTEMCACVYFYPISDISCSNIQHVLYICDNTQYLFFYFSTTFVTNSGSVVCHFGAPF